MHPFYTIDHSARSIALRNRSTNSAHLSHSLGFALDQIRSAARTDFDARFDGGHRTRPSIQRPFVPTRFPCAQGKK
jgi:hypothetical protein